MMNHRTNMNSKATEASRGFTFVETLVAISILLMAIAAAVPVGSQGLAATRVARDQVIGTYRAQEAIEYVRNVRDTNTLAAQDWLQGLEECLDNVCMIDINKTGTETVESCSSERETVCDPLVFYETTGLYGLSGGGNKWIETKFTRSLLITVSDANPQEALVTATITWKDGLANRSLSVEESILDWQ